MPRLRCLRSVSAVALILNMSENNLMYTDFGIIPQADKAFKRGTISLNLLTILRMKP